jgi:hypothetical protein
MKRRPGNFPVICCYMFALITLAMAILPDDAWAIFGGLSQPVRQFALVGAGIFFVIGLTVHVVLYRLDPAAFSRREFWYVMAKMAVCCATLFAISFVLARATGLPARVLQQRFLFGLLGFLVVVVVLLLVLAYLSQKLHAGNRMARLIAAGDFAGAIRIGEDRLRKKREYITVFNLAMAYARHGERRKAAELLPELEANTFGQTFATPEAEKQLLDHLRTAIDPATSVLEGSSSR